MRQSAFAGLLATTVAALLWANAAAPSGGPNVERVKAPLRALDFSASRLDGRVVQLNQLKGKVVFLNFWATWCVPCREEMPAMERVHERYHEQPFKMIGMNMQETREAAAAFAKELNIAFDITLDPSGEVAHAYDVKAIPVTYIIDKQGFIVARAIGARPWDGPEYKEFFDLLVRSATKDATSATASPSKN